VIDIMKQNSEWVQQLERQNGGPVTLRSVASISFTCGTINRIG
jgi:hypothetical protein